MIDEQNIHQTGKPDDWNRVWKSKKPDEDRKSTCGQPKNIRPTGSLIRLKRFEEKKAPQIKDQVPVDERIIIIGSDDWFCRVCAQNSHPLITLLSPTRSGLESWILPVQIYLQKIFCLTIIIQKYSSSAIKM